MSWWDVVSSKLMRGDVLFTPGRGKEGLRKKPFEILSVTSSSLKILSGDYPISLERECFDVIEREYFKNPFASLRIAAIKENDPLDDSADKLIRQATGSNMARGNYVCAILEHCELVRYEMSGKRKVIVLNNKDSI